MKDLDVIFGLEIPIAVRKYCEDYNQKGGYFYVGYLSYVDGEIIEQTFAARKYKSGLKITEVRRRSTGGLVPRVKNLLRSAFSGYVPVFENKDKYYRCGGYPYLAFPKEDFDKWELPGYHINLAVSYINLDTLQSIDEFKYCGYSGGDLIAWLDKYREDPSIEMFGKMGLNLSPVIVAKVKKDKQFRKYLWQHHKEIALYGVQATLYAYKHGMGIEEARRVCATKNSIDREVAFMVPEVKGTKIDRGKLHDYVLDLKEGSGSYNDYLKAIKALKLDLKDTKNVFPRDFKAMHDLRIAEYTSIKAKLEREKKKELYDRFAAKGKTLKALEYRDSDYVIKIPLDIEELVSEGESLHHCVGRMGYDVKVADGKSIIAFVRKAAEEDKPFVTAEYRVKDNTVGQCYADHNTKPPQEVITLVSVWAAGIPEYLKNLQTEDKK